MWVASSQIVGSYLELFHPLQPIQASSSSPSWRSKQSQLVGSSKLVVAGLSFAELGTAQPQLVFVCIVFVVTLVHIGFTLVVINKIS